jgi:hypothetical protein
MKLFILVGLFHMDVIVRVFMSNDCKLDNIGVGKPVYNSEQDQRTSQQYRPNELYWAKH